MILASATLTRRLGLETTNRYESVKLGKWNFIVLEFIAIFFISIQSSNNTKEAAENMNLVVTLVMLQSVVSSDSDNCIICLLYLVNKL